MKTKEKAVSTSVITLTITVLMMLMPVWPCRYGDTIPGQNLLAQSARKGSSGRLDMNRRLLDAVLFCNAEKTRALLGKGADPNARAGITNWSGMTNYSYLAGRNFTALMVAADRGCVDVAALLIGKGADVTLKDVNGSDALDIAREMHNQEMVEYLAPLFSQDR